MVKDLVMENSLVKSGGAEKPKKSRSLDIQSVYKKGGSKNEKRKGDVDDNGELEKNDRKKKSRKEAFLSSFEGNSSFDKGSGDGVSSNKSHESKGKFGIRYFSGIEIPKRPRGFVRRKTFENNRVLSPPSVDNVGDVAREQVFENVGSSSRKSNSVNKIAKVNDSVQEKIVSPKSKGKLGVEGNKKSKKKSSSSRSKETPSQGFKVEKEVHLVANDDVDALSSKKRSSQNRKRKSSEILSGKVKPVAGSPVIDLVDSDVEDEGNLEENAARMLSSRFDPCCTQSSPQSRSPGINGLSMAVVSDEAIVSRKINMSAGSEFESGEFADRVLRPRKKHKEDDMSKKRRHFYDILYKNLDPYWVLHKRIKVFWPLDESWYYGSVIGYCPEKKLHHIKYDDRDEEWIDFQNEKFKLLLLPSEVPHKAEWKGDVSEYKNDNYDAKNLVSDDKQENSDMDSEPLISWLGRSSDRVKSSHLGSSKRHKTSYLSPKLSKKLSIKAGCKKEHLGKCDSAKNLSCALARAEKSTDMFIDEKEPVVYVRRRFKKADKQLNDTDSKSIATSGSNNRMENDISLRLVEYERLLLIGNSATLKLTTCIELQKVRLEDDFWWVRALFLFKYGTVSKKWPQVSLEILVVDNVKGLRFLIFEGSLKQAVEFVLLVTAMFKRPNEMVKPADLSMPVTSIRFRLSCSEDPRKRLVFAVYSFLGLKSLKWLYLDSELQQHCLLAKQLPLPECTYDNIKALESSSDQLLPSTGKSASSTNEVLSKESLHGLMPKSDSVHTSFKVDMSPQCSVKQGRLPPFAFSFSAVPSIFLSLHLKLLVDNNLASIGLKDKAMYSLEHPGKLCHTVVEPTLESEKALNCSGDVAYTSARSENSDKEAGDAIARSLETEGGVSELKQVVTTSRLLVCKENVRGLTVEVPNLQPDEMPFVATPVTATHHTLKSDSKNSRSFRLRLGNPKFVRDSFSGGPRKPRTHVEYTVPSVGLRSSSKNSYNPSHKVRKPNDIKGSELSRNLMSKKAFLACDANVLITAGEKGWRECGARVDLESADQNEWKLVVKFSGVTKFSHKAYQIMQPGSTNRYTHAMMWRGDKDWVLEFPDRNQWSLFKEMYEECLNRNLRAASVKNIPIPGVHLIEQCDSNRIVSPFVRSFSGYIRQVETDVEMAMDPSRVLYDMDSEDEIWVSVNGGEHEDLSEELFEKTMDMLEKLAFAQQRDDFDLGEIEEFMAEIVSMKSIRSIYEHWQKKRQRKGMPLLRHLQPPLWESYQGKVKEWEQAVAKANCSLSSNRAPSLEKPPVFAFCQKPRGLEMPNKGSKQRSQRKYAVSGHGYSPMGDHDGYYPSGRRGNGYGYGEGNSHEYLDISPSFKPPTRVFSPREAGGFGPLSLSNDSSERNHYPKSYRNKSKNVGSFRSPHNVKILGPYNQKAGGRINGANRSSTGLSQLPSRRHNPSEVSLRYGVEQLDGSDLDEFRLRDASSAAQHARTMARLKRENAQRLLYRADMATHKAVVALMTAEAIKAASEDLNDDDDDSDDESTEDDDTGDGDSGDDTNDSESTR